MKVTFNHNLLSHDLSDVGYIPVAFRKKVFLEELLGAHMGLIETE